MAALGGIIGGLLLASVRLHADPPPGYYAAATDLTGGPLKQALHNIVANHTTIGYTNLIPPLTVLWRDPANPSNILLTYSHTSVPTGSGWNREHLWPRSRGNSDQAGPDDSDLFHVVPTDPSVNALRASLYYDESDPGDPGYRIPASSLAPQTSLDSDSFQPPPQERGAIARALFYMDVVYDGSVPQTTDMDLVSFPPTGSQMGRLSTLLVWNAQYPPDDAERARNDLIYSDYQHNRNPFIDHPEWATAIWGTGTPNVSGSRPIAHAVAVAASAVEAPATPASFQVALNQFAGEGGLPVQFTMSGTADLNEYSLGGAGVTYDPATGQGSVVVPANFSTALVTLTPVNDNVPEPTETAVATLREGAGYTVVPDASSTATLTISDAPGLPAYWSFNSGVPYANPLAANTGTGTLSFSGWLGTINSFTGTSGLALALVGSGGNNSWIDFHVSMSGYTALRANFATRGTSGGFTTGVWSASIDGVNFNPLPGLNTATTNTSFVQRQVDFSGLPELTNAPDVTLRYTLSGATSTSGNNRLDELTLSATPFVSGDGPRTVSVAASDASANETTLDPGTFTVQLNGYAPAGGQDVTLAFTGTATAPGNPGADYTLSGLASYDPATGTGHLLIPEGQTAALVIITPVADSVADGGETVIASVVSSDAYLVGTNSQAIITIAEAPANDAFNGAVVLTGTQATATGTNVGATHESGEPSHASTTGAHSVWWRWTAPRDGVVQIHTRGSNFDTLLAVYTGTSVNALTQLGANDDGGGNLTSLLNLRVRSGVTYSIAVDGYGASSGLIVLNLLLSPPPTVSLAAVNSVANERGSVPAVVRFTLSNSVPLDTTLFYTLGGTALAGLDYGVYPNSWTSLTIPAGTTAATLTLTPLTDYNPLEGTETITLVLSSSTNYAAPASPQNAVSLTILDDSPFSAAWISEHPGLTLAEADPMGDADGDGIPTLLEYVANRDPHVADGAALLTIGAERFVDPADNTRKTFAAIRFVRRTDAGSIPLTLEVTNDPAASNWDGRGVLVSTTPLDGTSTEELLFRSPAPLKDSAAAFFRLRATLP